MRRGYLPQKAIASWDSRITSSHTPKWKSDRFLLPTTSDTSKGDCLISYTSRGIDDKLSLCGSCQGYWIKEESLD
jgi:hypothetical protein